MKVNIYKIIGKFRQDLVKVFNLVIVALTEVTLSYSYVSCFFETFRFTFSRAVHQNNEFNTVS